MINLIKTVKVNKREAAKGRGGQKKRTGGIKSTFRSTKFFKQFAKIGFKSKKQKTFVIFNTKNFKYFKEETVTKDMMLKFLNTNKKIKLVGDNITFLEDKKLIYWDFISENLNKKIQNLNIKNAQ